MAGIHTVKRSALLLLLCFSLLTTASAFAPDLRSDISIRITPPSGEAVQRAEVEVQFTDNTGSGLQTAHVKVGDESWHEVTGQLDRTDNRYRCVAEVTENCTVTARAIGRDGTVFEKSEEINCFAAAPDGISEKSEGKPEDQIGQSERETVPLTPDGQASVLDDATEEDGKEFFTFKTPGENVFYLVVDRQKNSENVYFLNAVTETDLMDLAEKDKEDSAAVGTATQTVSAIPEPEPEPEPICNCTEQCVPGEVKADCPVCVLALKDCIGKAPVPEDSTEKEKTKEEKGGSGMIFVILAALAVGGVGYYLKIYKPKRELDDAEDFDDLIADEETVNEDEMEADAVPIPMDDDWDWGHEDKPDEPKRQDETVEPVEQDKPQGVLEESTRQDDAQGGPDDTVRQTWMKGEPDEPDEPDELARQNDEEPSNDSGVPDASERAADSQPLHLEREDYGVVELDESEDDDSEGNSLYM